VKNIPFSHPAAACPASPRTLPDDVTCAREIKLTYVMLALTTIACLLAAWQLGGALVGEIAAREWSAAAGQALFISIVALLIWGNFIYQLTRLGYLKRCAAHQPAARNEIEQVYEGNAPPLAILVPSYKEEIDVVRRTLLSAALQDYPNRRVVLLIDDPVNPSNPMDADLLDSARARCRVNCKRCSMPRRNLLLMRIAISSCVGRNAAGIGV
jgi:cellulose synthase (UDP-forming)